VRNLRLVAGSLLLLPLTTSLGLAAIQVPTAAALAAALTKPEPEYPSAARQLKVTGDVQVEITIGEEGQVEEVKVLHGNALLSDSVIKTLRRWKFKPFQDSGKPSTAVTMLRFTFRK